MGATYIKVRKYGRFFDWAKKYNYTLEVIGERFDEVVFHFSHNKYDHSVIVRKTNSPCTWYQVHARYNGETYSQSFRAQLRLKQILFMVDDGFPTISDKYICERKWTKGGTR